MKPLIVAAWCLVPCLAVAQQVEVPPQSPPRPTPAWVKIIDQGAGDPRLKGYFTPEGVKVEIAADFPVVANPVGMTFGPDGTLYVLEWRPDPDGVTEQVETITYRDGTTRKMPTARKRVTDVVKVLRDTTGKGVHDEAKVLLEEELPSSILIHDGWLYLSGRGTVRRYKLADLPARDGKPKAEVIAQGFGGTHHYQVSGLAISNDGWLYITAGAADHFVEGSDGSRATVLRTGAVFRCRPDGSRMQVFAIGFVNPYRDPAFDASGNLFLVDNDYHADPKFSGCRLLYVPKDADFGWRRLAGSREPDPASAAVNGERPGTLPPLLRTGRGAASGLLIYNDSYFPEQYRGLVYYPDVHRQLIRAYRVEPRGAGFRVAEEFEFLKSADPLFRPCQMVVGPDGAMYVCDWRADPAAAGKAGGDGKHGRIWRLSWAGTADDPALPLRGLDRWAQVAKRADDELVQSLIGDNATDRQQAQQEIVRRGIKFRPELLKLMADVDQPAAGRYAALGALQAFWNNEVKEAMQVRLRDRDPDVRRLAADALGLNCNRRDTPAHNALIAVLNDEDPAARRAVLLAIGKISDDSAGETLVNVLKFDDGRDPFLTDGYLRAIERTGRAGIQQLIDLADSGFDQERNKVIEAFLGLRSRPAADAIPKLLSNPHLSIAQRAALVRSSANYQLDPPLSFDPVLDYLSQHGEDATPVKQAVLDALAAVGPLSAKGQRYAMDRLDDRDDPTLAGKAVQALGKTPAGARLVAERFLNKKLSPELRPQVIAALSPFADKDVELAKLLAEVMKEGKQP